MPKSDKHYAVARQWQMLKMIPTRAPGITVRTLVERLQEEGYSVSARTVERDLNALEPIFQNTPIPDTQTRAQCWYYPNGKVPDIGSIDLIDAVSLALAGEVLETLLPGVMVKSIANKIEKARRKLKSLEKVPLARWSDKVRYVSGSYDFMPPVVKKHILEAVQSALLEDRQVEVEYESFNQKPKLLQLHPLGLVLQGKVPYLVATAFEYTDVRLYAIHRIRRVALSELAIIQPPDYSLDTYLQNGLMDFESAGTIKLKARLSNELAMYLTETRLSEDQKIQYKNGHWQLCATVRDSWQLHFWLLSQGSGIVVMAPKYLRERIKHSLEEAISGYTT